MYHPGQEFTADITTGLTFGRAEVLRGLRNSLNTDRPEHHSIDSLKEAVGTRSSLGSEKILLVTDSLALWNVDYLFLETLS